MSSSRARRTVQFERRPSQRYARRQSHVVREKEKERRKKEKEKKQQQDTEAQAAAQLPVASPTGSAKSASANVMSGED